MVGEFRKKWEAQFDRGKYEAKYASLIRAKAQRYTGILKPNAMDIRFLDYRDKPNGGYMISIFYPHGFVDQDIAGILRAVDEVLVDDHSDILEFQAFMPYKDFNIMRFRVVWDYIPPREL